MSLNSSAMALSRKSLGFAVRYHGSGPKPTEEHNECVWLCLCAHMLSLHVVFVLPDGTKKVVPALEGQSILETAHASDVDLEGMHKLRVILSITRCMRSFSCVFHVPCHPSGQVVQQAPRSM